MILQILSAVEALDICFCSQHVVEGGQSQTSGDDGDVEHDGYY